VLNTESLREVVARSGGNYCQSAVDASAHNCLGYSGAGPVTTDSDDGPNARFERVLSENRFVPGGPRLDDPPNVGSLKNCFDLCDSLCDAPPSRRRVDDYFN
jgi:hypothetical protein